MGLDNAVSRSEVSRVCQALIDDVNDFRQRPLDGYRAKSHPGTGRGMAVENLGKPLEAPVGNG